jgi:serine/threonine protein phosphatase PrpC
LIEKMGAGASTLDPEEKARISRALREEYEHFKQLHQEESPEEEMKLFENLKSTYTHSLQQTIMKSQSTPQILSIDSNMTAQSPPPIEKRTRAMSFRSPKTGKKPNVEGAQFDDGEHNDHYEFGLHSSVATQIQSIQPDAGSSISKIEGPHKLLRAKTSAQLLSMVNDAVIDEQDKIANFISLLKSGEMQTKGNEFRQRRLTYGQQTVSDDGHAVAHAPPSQSPKSATKPRASRTTIFASCEIGVKQEKRAPFPPNSLGTYSCHGIEPSDQEEDGIHEKINQDRGCVVYPYNSQKNEALFMVLDGHGEQGDKVSEFVMRQIVVSLEKDPLLETDPVQALRNAYITTNTALLVTDIQSMTSGCTCVTVYCRDRKLYVANAGDSRAVMCYKDGDAYLAKNLTRDHKPDDPEERERIEACGGFVCPPHEEGLSSRVYLDPEFTMIGLAMSRSIGDHAVKKVGVTADPEVLVFDVEDNDCFMVMASDGVWEFISSQESVEIVQACLDDPDCALPDACQELIEEAASRWQEEEGDYRDDITAIVVRFPLQFSQQKTRSYSIFEEDATAPIDQ